MTLATTTNRVSANGNGVTTSFSFPYYFLNATDLVVLEVTVATGAEVTKTLNTDYTVSGAGNPAGGTVTATSAPATGKKWVIYRDVPLKQTTNPDPGIIDVDAMIELPFDRAMMIAQRLSGRIDRCVRGAEGDTDALAPLPPAISRANTVLGFDGTGALQLTTLASTSAAQAILAQALAAATAAETGAYSGMALADVIAAVGSTQATVPVGSIQNITGDLTIPANVDLQFFSQGSLNITAGKTVTILGTVSASPRQIFSGAGVVSFAGNTRMSEVTLEWWGMVARVDNTSADNHNAIMAAVTATPNGWQIVKRSNVNYNVGTTLHFLARQYLTFRSEYRGPLYPPTGLVWTGINNGTMIFLESCFHCEVSGLKHDANALAGYLVYVDGGSQLGSISSANRILRNEMILKPTAVGVIISDTATTNNEYMDVSDNSFNGSGGVGGTGVKVGNSANAFHHRLFGNTFVDLDKGIHLVAGGVKCDRGNFTNCNTDIYIENCVDTVTIENGESEQSDRFIYCLRNDAPLVVCNNRIGSQPPAGEGIMYFGANAQTVEFTGNAWGLDVAGGSYHFDLSAAGNNLRLTGWNNAWGNTATKPSVHHSASGGEKLLWLLNHTDAVMYEDQNFSEPLRNVPTRQQAPIGLGTAKTTTLASNVLNVISGFNTCSGTGNITSLTHSFPANESGLAMIVFTNAAPPTFVAGSNIGRNRTFTQNLPELLYFDGTKWW